MNGPKGKQELAPADPAMTLSQPGGRKFKGGRAIKLLMPRLLSWGVL